MSPTVLVSGAATGIGAAIVRRLTAAGATVVGIGLDAEDADRLAADVESGLGSFEFRPTDVTDEAAVSAAVAGIDRLDGAVISAGIYPADRRLEDVSLAEFRQVIEVNLVGAFLTCRAVLPALRRSEQSSLVTLSSVHAVAGAPGQGAYAASKAGLVGLTRQLAVDYVADGVRANAVLAGSVDTRITQAAAAAAGGLDRLGLSADPRQLGRIADPDEVARVVQFLLSADSTFITGAALLADGGLTARIL